MQQGKNILEVGVQNLPCLIAVYGVITQLLYINVTSIPSGSKVECKCNGMDMEQ